MRSLTATITAYKFTELPPEVQAKLIQKQASINATDRGVITDEIEEDFSNDLKELSLPDLTAIYSLNSLQGDGVAFEGTITINKLPGASELPTGIRKNLQILQPGERYPELTKVINSIESEYPGSSKLKVTHDDHHAFHAYSFEVELQALTTHNEIYDNYQHAFERGISSTEPDDAFERFVGEEHAYTEYVLEQLRNISRSFEKHGYAVQAEHASEETARDMLTDMEDRLYLEDGTPIPPIFLENTQTP